jgi:5-methylcytosine-specific restriction enzyme subunit McrC
MNRHLAPLLTLAKMILGNRNPDLGRSAQGSRNTYALIWDMNVLFEEYVGRVTQQVLTPKGLWVDLQGGSPTYLALETTDKQNAFLLKPDILVRRRRIPWVVADTKWKRLDIQKTNLGVSESDVYQALVYAQRYGTDQAVLLYPHHPSLKMPGLQRDFLIQRAGRRQIRVRIVTLDLGKFESVPGQLEESLESLPPS